MTKLSCAIVKDLLPLYCDHVCSEESNEIIKEHLEQCSCCRLELEKLESEIEIPYETILNNRKEGNAIKALSDFWNRSKTKAFLKGALITALVSGTLLAAYVGLFQWNILDVPTKVIEIRDICRLSDGRIAYHVSLTDGYDLRQINFQMDEKGNFYLTPRRPIVKTKPIAAFGPANMYYVFGDMETIVYQSKYGKENGITALYFGSPEDHILIWQQGMQLPPASEAVEAEFTQD